MVVSLRTKLDMENGGTGAPSVITPGLRWIFRGFISDSGGAPTAGQFKVNGGALTTYNIGSIIGANDNPSIDITASPRGTFLFEYNIEQCDIGSTLAISNTTCPTCNAGTGATITVCNGACTVNLFNYLTGGPDAAGAWSHVSGPQTLTFTGGDVGTVNFSGKTAGTYVARYTVLTCTVDMTIIVQAPPNAGNDVTVDRCDSDEVIVDFESTVGGTIGLWAATSVLPSFGIVNIGAKTYLPKDGDGGIVPSTGTYGTAKIYTFQKTVTAVGIVSECANVCNDTAVLTVRVYPRFQSGTSALNTVICNDGSQRNLRDLLNGEDAGGQWDFFGVQYTAGGGSFTADLIINGVNTPGYTGTGSNFLFSGADNGTIGFMAGSPAGDYRFRYKLPNQNTACGGISQVGFAVQACTPTCTGNNPTILQNISGNCVNSTRGGSVSNLATETWTYRTAANGTFISYTPGTNVCGQSYVEFRYVLTFSNGCPAIQRTTTFQGNNPTCNNTPTVSASFASCAFTITGGGSTTSPISTSNLQWRYQGNINWNTYTSPITITGTATIEYRRIVSYSDGCPQTTTTTQSLTGQCGTSCNVSIGINSNNNLLTANTSGCGSAGQTINWYFSANNTTYGGIIGTGFSYTPGTAGYYKAILTCGSCTDEDIFQYVPGPAPCAGSTGLAYNGTILTATRSGCAGTISYDWRYSATGSGWGIATGNANTSTLVPQDGPGYYRVFTFCNGDCLMNADYQIMAAACNNNPGVSCNYNTGTCLYTLTPNGSNQSSAINDIIEWKPQGSGSVTQYSVPFAHSGPIEFRRIVNYFDSCPAVTTPWTTCNGTCCTGNTIDVTCALTNSTCQYVLTNVTSVTNTIVTDVVRWRPAGASSWNNYTGPFIHQGAIEYDRTVTLSGGCGTIATGTKNCGGNCCSGNNPSVSCNFNTGDCKYTLTPTGTNVSTVSSDVIQYRPTGASTWSTYVVPFVYAGAIEYRRVVTYSTGCPTIDTGVLNCSGNCCPAFTLSTALNGSNQIVATTGGCGGTVSVIWYFGTTAGSTNTQVGTGSTLTPVNGAGYYKAVATCSAGNCVNESTYQLACSSNASLNTSLTVLTVTGLTSCASPVVYTWQYSSNGSTGWATASGATNSGSLTMNNGNGWYRVIITCNGICPITLSYQRNCVCDYNTFFVTAFAVNATVVEATVTGCSGGITYQWSAFNGGAILSGQGTLQINTNGYGSYQCNISCANSCGAACSISTGVVNLCSCGLAGGSISNTGINAIQVSGLSGCSGSISYQWSVTSGGQIIGSSTGSSIQTNGLGTYQVIATCSSCAPGLCTRTISYNYSVQCSLTANLTISNNTTSYSKNLNYNSSCSTGTGSLSWEESTNGTTWGPTSDVSTSNLIGTANVSIVNKYYRYKLTCSCGVELYSNSVFVYEFFGIGGSSSLFPKCVSSSCKMAGTFTLFYLNNGIPELFSNNPNDYTITHSGITYTAASLDLSDPDQVDASFNSAYLGSCASTAVLRIFYKGQYVAGYTRTNGCIGNCSPC